MARKTYDAATIAHALATCRAEGNLLRASNLLGISRSTLRAWSSGQLPAPVANEPAGIFAARQTKATDDLARSYREVEGKYRAHLLRDDIVAKTSAAQAAIVVGVMSDKATRAEGGPTSISEVRSIRYVEPAALRSLASRVIDVRATPVAPATPALEPREASLEPREGS